MDRRSFVLGLGSVPALRSIHGQSSSLGLSASKQSKLELKNGNTRMTLARGERGFGIEVFDAHAGVEHLLAKAETPIRVFYGPRSAGKATEIAFVRATKNVNALAAWAEFRDSQGNQWEVTYVAELCENDGFRCRFDYRLFKGSAQDVFFEHPFSLSSAPGTENTYVLMPGLLYDGNRLTVPASPHEIPQLTAAQDFTVDTPVLTLSVPVAVFQDKQTGLTFMYVTEPVTDLNLDMSGLHCVARPDGFRISVTAPCYREKHYHHNRYIAEAPRGASVEQGGRFSVSTALFAGTYADRLDLYHAIEPIRQFVRTPFQRDNRLPLSAAAHLVEENLNTQQWCQAGFYANAMMPDFNIAEQGCCKLTPSWQLLNGWGAGPITGYALLKMGDETSRKRARTMLDLIATGIAPSGLFWSIYVCGSWDAKLNNTGSWQHMRMPADATFYMLKAIDVENRRGVDHAQWRQAAVSNLDAFVRLWQANRDFGWMVDRNTLAITKPCTAAAALCIGALALGSNLPGGRGYLSVARESADTYFERCVKTGWIVAGPLDIPNAPDSESPTALLESYVTLYEATRDEKYLGYASEVAYQLATWIVAYNAKFPAGTICDRLGTQSTGGVLANSQNHHIGPSFCTNSGSALLRLFQHTGETRWLRLLEDTITGLPQYMCSHEGVWKHMKPGMMTEQFDMSDELSTRGDAPEVSASWPATCVLLSYADLPSVYVDVRSKSIGVFDQITVKADWQARALHLNNPTSYPAQVRVEKDDKSADSLTLAPSEEKTVKI